MSTYIKLYKYYLCFCSIFHFFFPVITFVYYIPSDENSAQRKKKNITLNVIFGIGLTNYNYGKYHVRMKNNCATYDIIYTGYLYQLHYIQCPSEILSVNRKKVLLLDNGNTIDTNIDFLDNYWMMTAQLDSDLVEKNVAIILDILRIRCTSIKIIDFPHIKSYDPNHLEIKDLYVI
jgi:hypothetical protein